MFALAAVAFATTFTSCEKEELSFNLKPQVASLTIDATVVVIEDGVTVETKSFTKTETSQAGVSIAAGSFAVSHTYTFQDGTVGSINETVTYPAVLPGQNVALTPTFVLSHNNVFPEQETTIVEGTPTAEAGTVVKEGSLSNASEYYWDTTVEYSSLVGQEVLSYEITADATYEESFAIEKMIEALNTAAPVKEETKTLPVVVYAGTKCVVTVTQAYEDKAVKIYRQIVEGSTRAEDVEIGSYVLRSYTGATAEFELFNLSDDKPGHGHGHGNGHGHGGENAGGGIIWE